MSVRMQSFLTKFVYGALLGVLATGGCCPRCESRCTPRGPWQSPTVQATRALLVVNTAELRILQIDGRNVRPSCIGAGGVREYHIPAGLHTITATFRYAGRVGGGVIGAVHGAPLTLQHQFVVGHEYVPIYREHPVPKREAEHLAEAIAAVIATPERYWSLEIADLAQAGPDPEPEVREARQYCAYIDSRIAAADPPNSMRIR